MASTHPDFLIFDYETLSNRPLNAAVISLGAIIGNWEDVIIEDEEGSNENLLMTIANLHANAFYQTVKTKRQVEKYGLEVNQETVRWWSQQGDFAKAMLESKNKVEIEENCQAFVDWCISNGLTQKTVVYIRAPHFDFTIMDNIFQKIGLPIPFNTFKIRDVRSIIDAVYGTDNGYVPGFKDMLAGLGLHEHYAVHDTIKDLIQLKLCRD